MCPIQLAVLLAVSICPIHPNLNQQSTRVGRILVLYPDRQRGIIFENYMLQTHVKHIMISLNYYDANI